MLRSLIVISAVALIGCNATITPTPAPTVAPSPSLAATPEPLSGGPAELPAFLDEQNLSWHLARGSTFGKLAEGAVLSAVAEENGAHLAVMNASPDGSEVWYGAGIETWMRVDKGPAGVGLPPAVGTLGDVTVAGQDRYGEAIWALSAVRDGIASIWLFDNEAAHAWTKATLTPSDRVATASFKLAAYGNELVAATPTPEGHAGIWLSTDGGRTWALASRLPDVTEGLVPIIATPAGFLAIGRTTAGTYAYHSVEARTWTRSLIGQDAIRDVAYVGGRYDGRYAAIGGSVAYMSVDGRTWTASTVATAADAFGDLRAVAAAGRGFVAVGQAAAGGPGIWTSNDGAIWVRVPTDMHRPPDISPDVAAIAYDVAAAGTVDAPISCGGAWCGWGGPLVPGFLVVGSVQRGATMGPAAWYAPES